MSTVFFITIGSILGILLFDYVSEHTILNKFKKIVKSKPTEPTEEEIRQQRETYHKRKKIINDAINKIKDLNYTARRNHLNEKEDECKKKNETCPKCKSKNIHHEFKRLNGQIDGEFDIHNSSSSSHSLFRSYSSNSSDGKGNLHGEMDTLQVNKCSECGDEWIYVNPYNIEPDSWYKGKIDMKHDAFMIAWYLYDLINLKYDKNDITEKFNSYEEKYNDKLKYTESNMEQYKDTYTIETMFYILMDYSYYVSEYRFTGVVEGFNEDDNYNTKKKYLDEYTGKFTDKVIKILEDFGFKHLEGL